MSILTRRAFAGAAAASLLFANNAFAHEFKLGALEIIHPWSRATPNGAKVAGGYFVIKNHGTAADRLVSVTADVAGRTGIHEMSMADGVMTMRELKDGIAIPANGEVTLAPKGYHVMLEDLKHPLKQGESIDGTLTFEKAGTINVTFFVEAMGASAPGDKGHDHEGHMDGMQH